MYRAYGDKIRLGIFVNIPPQVAAQQWEEALIKLLGQQNEQGKYIIAELFPYLPEDADVFFKNLYEQSRKVLNTCLPGVPCDW